MQKTATRSPLQVFKTLLLLSFVFLSSCALLDSKHTYISHQVQDDSLIIQSEFGEVRFTALPGEAIEVHYLQAGVSQLPSFAKEESLRPVKPVIEVQPSWIALINGGLTAVIDKSDLSVGFYRGSELLVRQDDYFLNRKKRGFSFELDETEKIMGGGERVLGMDRRGFRMPLYNRAHYDYSLESNQMYFGLPVVLSNKHYALLFDNSASGFLDIGKTSENTLSFEAVGGRTAYIVFAGETYPELINHYVDVTGKQPLPPRWAFGNFASRFGYRSEQQVRDTVDLFLKEDFPLDAVILDLYWYGPDIQGHVGNLDWDRETFPTPVKMLKDLDDKGVKTIVVTQPFVLSSSKRWQDAVDNKVLAKDDTGEPMRYDFYFGNTGLIDVFDENARLWFWDKYANLLEQGVAGTWGDLGEPEVHPDDIVHYLSETNSTARGDEVHNVYGHEWAKMVFQNQRKLQPETRPFIMMRAGFAGSQRFGMIPWTGDVQRGWDGLKPQIELTLQMGLLGMGYTHSDLGGFAHGEALDKEMYIRWLQYGVFQPVYRPHGQDHIPEPPIPSEPVFHDRQTRDITREYIKLRYRLMPYNYTLAFENSTTGMPLMRPVFFEDETDPGLFNIKDTYLWGDAFLVSPVVNAGETVHEVALPKGVWFDFWDDSRYFGNTTAEIPVSLETIPVLVRAGSFIPMVDDFNTTRDYSSENLTLHYYADESVSQSSGQMYEDDGHSFGSIENGSFELLHFSSQQERGKLQIRLSRDGHEYTGMPQSRLMKIIVHNWEHQPGNLNFDDKKLTARASLEDLSATSPGYFYDAASKQLTAVVQWQHQDTVLSIQSSIGKPVVYQVFTRLFGNKVSTNKPWGTIEENGVGKFDDFTHEALEGISEFGTSHIWYTGVPHHAVIRDYTEYGISNDDPDVVKGRAGSPYAIKDYYNVNPDLAVDPARRLEEFKALLDRTHQHGMKVIIDIVPNHIARAYQSNSKPAGLKDFGEDDDSSLEYNRDNNFYYISGESFKVPALPDGYQRLGGEKHPLLDGEFEETPAKWTGNGSRKPQPDIEDWYETVKVNYGVRPDGSYDFDRLPENYQNKDFQAHYVFWADKDVPDSWEKFRDIVLYWTDLGVDGFRYDMAEMVPVEFWSYLNSAIKTRNPEATIIAEVYNPDLYRDYIYLGKMDYLYDKVDLYDTLKLIMQGKEKTSSLLPIIKKYSDIDTHMLHFLENHDEQRIASPDFAGDANKGKPAMVVSALIGKAPTMLFYAQALGEAGEGDAGHGDPTRTSIYDYWGIPSLQRWMNDGKFDGGQLTPQETSLRGFYTKLLSFTANSPALKGNYTDLHENNIKNTNNYDEYLFSFTRWNEKEKLIVISNFSADKNYRINLQITDELIAAWHLDDGIYHLGGVFSGDTHELIVEQGKGRIEIKLAPLESEILSLTARSSS
jgi:oligosaccharide 4-alpha-D-glucosyltransferase